MKKKSFFHLISLLTAAVCFCTFVFRGKAEKAQSPLTIMVYMCGSNLESGSGAATLDLLEMANSGYDFRQVNLLVMTGGTSSWALGIPTDALCIYQPGRGQLRMLYAFEPISMGSADALTALLDFGYERYPAERYALILWDHGGGPLEGLCWDENFDGDRMTLAELCQGLGQSPAASRRLEWIGFDACLMATSEVAKAVSPYAKYMIASQETEPGTGWNYAFLNQVHLDENGADTGRRIIDLYMEGAENRTGLTLSCLDLDRMEELSAGMDRLFSRVEITAGNYGRYSFAASQARAFGKSATGEGGYDLADLGQLIGPLADRYPEETGEVERILSEAVLYSQAQDEQSMGISVYHPGRNKAGYVQGWGAAYSALGFSAGYTDYLSQFASYLFGTQAVSWEGLTPLPAGGEGMIALPMTKEQADMLLQARIDLLRWHEETGTYAPVGSLSNMTMKDGTLYAVLSGQSLALTDASGETVGQGIPYEVTPEGDLGIYVNVCPEGTENTPEAWRVIPVDVSGERRSGWTVTTNSESPDEILNYGTSTVSGMGTNQTLTSETVSLGEAYGHQNRGQLALISPYRVSEETGWVDVPTGVSAYFEQLQGTMMTAGAFYAAPETHQTLAVTPVSLAETYGEFGSIFYTGPQLTLNDFPSINMVQFDPSATVIEIGEGVPSRPAADEREGVQHLWLRCAASPDGTVTVREIWRYNEASAHWRREEELPHAGACETVFPERWYSPVTDEEGGLYGVSAWQETERKTFQAVRGAWSLEFRTDENSDLCAAFCLTDHQNRQHESIPVPVTDILRAGERMTGKGDPGDEAY